MREEHCSFAELNSFGRCIAACYYVYEADFEEDCIGITRLPEKDQEVAGREYQLGGRFRKHGTKLS
ncbi:MAG: hypothetical protein ACYTE8_00485 [Planctomycetota bacterium]|jgi:hypothetical protein